MEHCRYLQRPDEHSEPARAAAAFRHGGQADQRIFCIGGLIAHNKKRLLHFRLKRCTTASFAIRAGVPVPAPHSAPSNRRPCGYSRTPCGTRYPPAQGSAAGRAPSEHAKKLLQDSSPKTLYETRNFFRAKTAPKGSGSLIFRNFPAQAATAFFQSPYSARVRLFSTRTVHVTIYIRNKKWCFP